MAECTCADPMAVKQAIDNQTKQQENWQLEKHNDDQQLHEDIFGFNMKIRKDGKDVAAEGTEGSIMPLRFCHWNAPEYGMIGTSKWVNLFRAAALAIAIANGLAQAEIADKQQDLADKWYSQAKYKWDRFSGKYMPLEKKLLNEVSSVPIRNIDCVGAGDRAQASVNSAYNSVNTYMAQQAKKLRLCLDPSLISVVNQKQNVALVDTENYNLTDERWYTDYKNDQRWNRRSNVLNLGRNLSSESMQYGKVANALYGQIGQQLGQAANGLMQAIGYYGARNDTYYSTTYLNTHTLTDSAGTVALNGAGGIGNTGMGG